MKVTTNLLKDCVLCTDIVKYKGLFKFRHYYFYRHGETTQNFLQKVQSHLSKIKDLPPYEVIEVNDNWNAWPKDSYFEVVIKFNV